MWRAGLACFCLTAVGAMALEPPLVLSAQGLNEISFGVHVDRLERILLSPLRYDPFANHGCSTVTTPALAPDGLSFVIENRKLTRINVDFYAKSDAPLTIKTKAGVGLASTEADVLKAYGSRAKVTPNPEDPTWHTITVDTPDQSAGVVFETDGKTVKSMRAGLNPTIAFPHPCRTSDY